MSMPLGMNGGGPKAAASRTTKGIPTGVLLIVVGCLAWETYSGQDVDLETYLPLLIPMGLGGLAKHALDAKAGRLAPRGPEGGAPLGGAAVVPSAGAPVQEPPPAPPEPEPTVALSKTELNNLIQGAIAQGMRQNNGGQGRRR